jgi:NMD protein affecting ribosome stability and mRNA decay
VKLCPHCGDAITARQTTCRDCYDLTVQERLDLSRRIAELAVVSYRASEGGR